MILNSFQYNGLTYFRKEEKKNGIGNSISAVLSLGNWFISDDHEYFILTWLLQGILTWCK